VAGSERDVKQRDVALLAQAAILSRPEPAAHPQKTEKPGLLTPASL
jgi:hypothetical protein